MPFDRWKSPWPRTWPYAIFKKHHTQLNNLYWSNAAAATYVTTAVAKANPVDPISSVLKISAENGKRLNFSISIWQGQFKEFENWTRLNALMALCGYLETYLHSIATLALTSDPGLLISSHRAVDGISLVKRGALPELENQITGLTKGTWQSRVRNYKRLFTNVPSALQSALSDLDSMRKLRNGVGHSFGRMIEDYRSPLLMQPLPVQRLSEERLQRWLGVVEQCVNAIEQHLRITHVGGMEVLLNYHAWNKKYFKGHMSEEKAFKATFPYAQGRPPGVEYFRSAIAFYRGA